MKRISVALGFLLIAYLIMATTGCVLRTVTGSGDLETRDSASSAPLREPSFFLAEQELAPRFCGLPPS